MSAGTHRYLLALGSNIRHPRIGAPPKVVRAAARALTERGIVVEQLSPVHATRPLGPSSRRFANAAAVVTTELAPLSLIAETKRIEQAFGRRTLGRRWRARILDIDIVLWSGGPWRSPTLRIPHPEFRRRAFVLLPAVQLAPRWRDPRTGLTLCHLAARLTRQRPTPTARSRSGP
jgi:2-amino-4-hydroxy-6-hydroxymethyldihydropteridine diphosphokinase